MEKSLPLTIKQQRLFTSVYLKHHETFQKPLT